MDQDDMTAVFAEAELSSGNTVVDRAWVTLSGFLDRTLTPIPTGFKTIDRALAGGLLPGSLTVVAGTSGSGTTTLALGIVRRTVVHEKVAASIVTVDVRPEDLMVRAMCAEGRVNHRKLMEGGLVDEDRFRLAEAGALLRESELEVVRPDRLDGPGVVARVRSEIAAGARLVVVDGADLMGGRNLDAPEFADCLRDVKAVAAEASAAVLVTARLPLGPTFAYLRGMPTSVHDTGPTADFIDLGAAARVADAVVMLHRPDRWDADHYSAGEADLALVKNPVGTPTETTVAHQMHICRFVDMLRG
ncbi:DnaB-like helicase C-terminal domain-containing protein [Gordonia phthalatica]|uniref:SF4 helicase domain-containing protein n=1 Tax=Gordonia phthalatica TaxID=1136941 RepID=A0A0N9MTG5_9ACTN|nr:DnaB-like helicase C-terminal domain-containing protein [Gordonia phthalatica]ALG86414.1 hypothetical protein ACH46_20350 [Gordonia phthalatica]